MKLKSLIKFPLLTLAFIWLVGLVIGIYIPNTHPWINGIVIAIAILFFMVSIRIFEKQKLRWFVFLSIAILLISVMRMQIYEVTHQSQLKDVQALEQQRIGIRGVIDSKPAIDGNQLQMVVKPSSILIANQEYSPITKERFLVRFYLQKEEELIYIQNYQEGSMIRLYGILSRPRSLNNPGLFHYEEYLSQQSIYWIVRVKELADMEVTEKFSLDSLLNKLHSEIEEKIAELYPNPYDSFIKGILIGDRDDLPVEIEKDFSYLGLSHLLAISGLHLSIFTLMISGILNRLRLSKEKIALITILFVLFYMLLTGASSSVVRASLMTILVLYGYLYKNSFHSLQALGLAFIIMTTYQPFWIFNIGFQLSFLITFFILWGTPKLETFYPITVLPWKKAISLLIITQLASFSLVLYHFHQYSFLAWLANFVMVPIFSMFILPIGILSLILSFILFPIAKLLSYVLIQFLSMIFSIIHFISQTNLFQMVGGFSSAYNIIVFYLILIWLLVRKKIKGSFIAFQLKKKVFFFEKLILGLLIIFISFQQLSSHDDAWISLIDVGQGDSILIETEKGQNILIDSGGSIPFTREETEEWKVSKDPFEIGEDVLVPYLYQRGIKKLQMAVLTHEDLDHIGGYLTLVDHLPIESFFVGPTFPRTESGKVLEKKLLEKNIPIYSLNNRTSLQITPDLEVHFIYLNESFLTKENDQSIITLLEAYQTKMLMMGDLEERGELNLIEKYKLNEVDILKVGHHGSKTSTSQPLLDAIKPTAAVISVGENNRYNHPSNEVIERLENAHIPIYRTDTQGAILIKINQKGYKIFPTNKVPSF